MDDRAFFEVDEDLTAVEWSFLAALRQRLPSAIRPYFIGRDHDGLSLVLDVDAPGLALVNVGLSLRGSELKGDRISVHHQSFPPTPTAQGFLVEGTPEQLADRGALLLEWFWSRPVVKHEWIHGWRIYAECYLFDDTGERLVEMYRSDLAPRGQEAQLIADGFVRGQPVIGQGWIRTVGLGEPDRVTLVRGSAQRH